MTWMICTLSVLSQLGRVWTQTGSGLNRACTASTVVVLMSASSTATMICTHCKNGRCAGDRLVHNLLVGRLHNFVRM
jgi:hypothetical protein